MIRRGSVIAVLMGPPCETWTTVRRLLLQDGETGPPPLRSQQSLWGIRDMTWKQRQQLRTGNDLLQAGLEIYLEAIVSGAAALLEHPQWAHWVPDSPTIWKLDQVAALLKHPKVEAVSFDQCEHSSLARKPTTLMALRLPTLKTKLRDTQGLGRCSHGKHKPLRGKGKDGKWSTAIAKEYPRGMCTIIAEAIMDFVRGKLPNTYKMVKENRITSIGALVAKVYPYGEDVGIIRGTFWLSIDGRF